MRRTFNYHFLHIKRRPYHFQGAHLHLSLTTSTDASPLLNQNLQVSPNQRIQSDNRQMENAKEEKRGLSSHTEEVHHFQTVSNLVEKRTINAKNDS